MVLMSRHTIGMIYVKAGRPVVVSKGIFCRGVIDLVHMNENINSENSCLVLQTFLIEEADCKFSLT